MSNGSSLVSPLPPGWELVELARVARINPVLECPNPSDEDEVNFIPMRAVEPEGGGLVRPETRPYGKVRKGYTAFQSGDVIMAKITPCMENGKTTVVPTLPGTICFGSTEFHVLRPESGIEAKWLANFLLQHPVRRAAQRNMTGGVGQMRVPASFLENIRIPIAPSAEQQRVTDAVDELLSDLEAGVTALKRVQKKLARYRETILNAAAEGKLTEQWREQHPAVESAATLKARILAERRQEWEDDELRKVAASGKKQSKNWRERYKEPLAPKQPLPAVPEGWCWATVGELGACEPNAITDGPFGSNLKTEHYTQTGPRVIRLQNIKDGSFADERAYISEEHFAKLKKHEIKAGDIAIAGLGENPPRCCIIPEGIGPAIVKADCIKFKPHSSLSAKCLMFFMNSLPTRLRMKTIVHGIGRPRMNLKEIKDILLPLPPIGEQEAIVEATEDQLSIVEHLEISLDAKLKSAEALRQSILRDAFAGQLMAQDPRDQPASDLLNRIASERAERAEQAFEKGRQKKVLVSGRPATLRI